MDERDELIEVYYHTGLKYKEIQAILAIRHRIIISNSQLKRVLKKIGLGRRRYSNLNDAITFIHNLMRTSAGIGYRLMHAKCLECGINIKMHDVRLIQKAIDPVAVEFRSRRRLQRRRYSARGPNFVWHLDGYDKLKQFGLPIHGCIDGFSRKIIWLKVYNTNNDSSVIGGYYVEAITDLKACPRRTRSDFGTENSTVRDFQLALTGMREAHLYGASTANTRIEAWWSFLLSHFTYYWLDVFRNLEFNGHFAGTFIDKNLVRFCFLGIIQVRT